MGLLGLTPTLTSSRLGPEEEPLGHRVFCSSVWLLIVLSGKFLKYLSLAAWPPPWGCRQEEGSTSPNPFFVGGGGQARTDSSDTVAEPCSGGSCYFSSCGLRIRFVVTGRALP